MSTPRIIYVYTSSDPALDGAVRVAGSPCEGAVSPFLPANCQLLRKIAENRIREGEGGAAARCTLRHCELSGWFDRKGEHEVSEQQVRRVLTEAGVKRLRSKDRPGLKDWFLCAPSTAVAAIASLKAPAAGAPSGREGKTTARKTTPRRAGHGAADALDWNEAMRLVRALYDDGRYRDALLVGSGCFLGLRISDLLTLRWRDIHGPQAIQITEKKTGKKRAFKINAKLRQLADLCHEQEGIEDDSAYVFANPGSAGGRPITRQRADQILKECRSRYGITSAKTFSTHSLRKTFGRRVWLIQCEKGKGDQALLLLCDVFGHSSIAITKRYLGIRQEEILSVYDNL